MSEGEVERKSDERRDSDREGRQLPLLMKRLNMSLPQDAMIVGELREMKGNF